MGKIGNSCNEEGVDVHACGQWKALNKRAHAGCSDVVRDDRRVAWRQEGIRAYDAYHETGLHLRGDDAETWLAQLERGNDVETPDCHL